MIGRRAASALTVAVTAAAVLTGCGGGGGDERVAGAFGAGVTDRLTGSAVNVQLPHGRLSVTLTKPMSAVPKAEAGDGDRHAAPDGKTYLGVEAKLQALAGIPTWQSNFVSNDATDPSLAFEVGGKTYAVGRDGAQGIPTYVLVPKGGDPQLEVRWHGVTQRVDVTTLKVDPGDAALLYAHGQPDTLPSHDCASGARVKPGIHVEGLVCHYSYGRMPYLPSLGWNRAGWVMVSYGATATTVRIGGHDYPVTEIKDASRLGGAKPVANLLPKGTDLSSPEPRVAGELAFAPGSSSLQLVQVLTLDDDRGHRPPSRTVTISQNVSL